MTPTARTTPAQAEREGLVSALRSADPSAPTLCEGWSVHDLAAHLVARERRLDANLTMPLPVVKRWTERVRLSYKRRSVAELADLLEAGPPRWTLAGLPGVDNLMNTGEYFVHAEDVRRGTGDTTPRELPDWRSEALWDLARSMGRVLYLKAGVGVTLRRPDGRTAVLRDKLPMATIEGEPGELLLHMFRRRDAAHVTLLGDPTATAKLG